jgi:hypothetical protein
MIKIKMKLLLCSILLSWSILNAQEFKTTIGIGIVPLYNPYLSINSNYYIGKSQNISTFAHVGLAYLIKTQDSNGNHFLCDFVPAIQGDIFINSYFKILIFAGPELVMLLPNFGFGLQPGIGLKISSFEIRLNNNFIFNKTYNMYWPSITFNIPIN